MDFVFFSFSARGGLGREGGNVLFVSPLDVLQILHHSAKGERERENSPEAEGETLSGGSGA